MRALTQLERYQIEAICQGIAEGKTAGAAAAAAGVFGGDLNSLLDRAKLHGIDLLHRIACLYADRFEEAVRTGQTPPPMQGQSYRVSIGIECARRGYDLRVLPSTRVEGISRDKADREIRALEETLEEGEVERLKDLMDYKVRLYESRTRKHLNGGNQ